MNLVFTVERQDIKRVDSNRVVADSRNYLQAEFIFLTQEWQDRTVTAVFKKGSEAFLMMLENNACRIPSEVIKPDGFSVSVFAGDLVTAGTAKVPVRYSGYTVGETPQPATPDVYAQIIERLDRLERNLPAPGDPVTPAAPDLDDIIKRLEALEQKETPGQPNLTDIMERLSRLEDHPKGTRENPYDSIYFKDTIGIVNVMQSDGLYVKVTQDASDLEVFNAGARYHALYSPGHYDSVGSPNIVEYANRAAYRLLISLAPGTYSLNFRAAENYRIGIRFYQDQKLARSQTFDAPGTFEVGAGELIGLFLYSSAADGELSPETIKDRYASIEIADGTANA